MNEDMAEGKIDAGTLPYFELQNGIGSFSTCVAALAECSGFAAYYFFGPEEPVAKTAVWSLVATLVPDCP